MRYRRVVVMIAAFVVMLTGLVVSEGANVQAAPPGVRATASVNVNSVSPTVSVPAVVEPGDQLVLVVTINSAATMSTPAGWTLLGTATDGSPDMRSSVFTRTADAASGGSSVTVALSAQSKTAMTLVAYSGAGVAESADVAVIGASSASLATPSVELAAPDAVVLSYWADKSSNTTGWTLPGSVTSCGDVGWFGWWSDHGCVGFEHSSGGAVAWCDGGEDVGGFEGYCVDDCVAVGVECVGSERGVRVVVYESCVHVRCVGVDRRRRDNRCVRVDVR